MAVALDLPPRIHAHAAGPRDAAEVVAREVHEHHVLGAFLRVGEEPARLRLVVGLVGAARQRARDRPEHRAPSRQPHERLGRGTGHRETAGLDVVHVGRGIEEPQCAIDLERLELALAAEADRKHQLVDIARSDVRLHARDRVAEVAAPQARTRGLVVESTAASGKRAAERARRFRG